MKTKIVFFGTPGYSLIVLNKLYEAGYPIAGVVTKPPRPIGRNQEMTPTPVAGWAESKIIPTLTPAAHLEKPWLFADEDTFTHEVLKLNPEILIIADYTQKIPQKLVGQVKYGGLNVHPSLLPAYRGPAPVPWAILKGETETGVSLVTLTPEFDAGHIIAREKEPILPTDTTDSLLTRLFEKGAELLVKKLPDYFNHSSTNYQLQTTNSHSYFPRLTRNDGFIPWDILKSAINGTPIPEIFINDWPLAKYFDRNYLIHNSSFIIHNSYRALHPWPGIWTRVQIKSDKQKTISEKRLKILKMHLDPKPSLESKLTLDCMQLEGKKPVSGAIINLLE